MAEGQTRRRSRLSKAERVEITTRLLPAVADAARQRARAGGITLTEYITGLIETDLQRGDETTLALPGFTLAQEELLASQRARLARVVDKAVREALLGRAEEEALSA